MATAPSRIMREKPVRLIEYLQRLASLRMKLVRNVADYEKVFWVNDIPKQRGCFSQAWGRDEDFDSDIWAEVQNRREPELPAIPDKCRDWVDKNALRIRKDIPELMPEISRQIRNPAYQEGSDQPEFIQHTERLKDYPQLERLWNQYIEERWLPWVEEYNIWESVYQAYSSLFSIHQEQLRLGEEYELVLGIGLLTWQTRSGQRVRRHLIVANALLDFEARLGKFTLKPNPDGSNIRPELDMLDIEDQPARAEESAKAALVEAGDDPWERACIEGVLKALVHSINPLGEYKNTLGTKNDRATTKPIVEFAPAFILRKRSAKGLTETLKRIKGRIENGEPIPTEFADLAEMDDRAEGDGVTVPESSMRKFSGEVYFPKPSNDEQRRIVDKIRTANGILVQGPPGTGKSHTIANLICHLLATGQRTLITAKTPRALSVLEGLVPEPLRPLCINLLGSGLEEKRSLEKSVGGILRRNDVWNQARADIDLETFEQKLHQLRGDKAIVERRLRSIRESETHSQTIAQGEYEGTLAQIAQAVNLNKNEFEWFEDVVPLDQSCPIYGNDLQNLLSGLRRFTPQNRQELSLSIPDSLPSPDRFADLVRQERNAIDEEHRLRSGADRQQANQLSKVGNSSIGGILDSLSDFQSKRRNLLASPHAWIPNAIRDVLGGSPTLWIELCRITRSAIELIGPIVDAADETDIEYPDNANVRTLFDDACKLRDHIKKGGKLGWGPFRPKPVKDRIHLLKTVRLNGRLCSNSLQFQILSYALRVRIECEKIWGFWADHCQRTQGPYAMQIQALLGMCDALAEVLALEEAIGKCRDSLRQCPSLTEPIWADEPEIEKIISSCRLALANLSRQNISKEIRKIEANVRAITAHTNAHKISQDVLDAIQNRDVDSFSRVFVQFQEIQKEKLSIQKVDEFLQELNSAMPILGKNLEQTYREIHWDIRVQKIQNAWHWKQAKTYIEEYINQTDAPSLAVRACQIEDEINAVIAKIASIKAWSFCFSRLKEDHRRHMEAWQQSMKRLGKGTGKHAPRHRREAQRHLNDCREAVPAWVMPLHRVWDTVDPAPGLFEMIIVDEASQCGFEALPLFYLGKKILIVGDDKQISPDAVGLPRDAVHRLMQEFLYDFDFKSSFDVEGSLFDHGKLRYGTHQVILREHFRCMPEIIRFSNDLCYRDTPLIPLRQYGPDRLNPIKRVFVDGGYREGTSNRAINRPEAKKISEKIFDLCNDSRYKGKTMGVVVLQGDAQAQIIEDALLSSLGAEEMERRRLVCGNPYSFQGDQRDIMFLSMVAAANERIGPLAKASDERRFNVAASRARDQMYLFHSVNRDDLSSSCMRRKLLEFFENTKPREVAGLNREELLRRATDDNRSVIKPPQPFDSWYEIDVALEILQKGFFIIPQFEMAGKKIDLVVEGGQARMAVECDGDQWHGAEQYDADMHRQRILERCGWEFFRVKASQFYADRQKALDGLWSALEERGIFPQKDNGFNGTDTSQKHDTRNPDDTDGKDNHKNKKTEFKKIKTDIKVDVGDTVVFVNIETPQTEKQAMITRESSNPEWGTINVNTPIAQALLGAAQGTTVEAKLPMGKVYLLIKEIKRTRL